MIERKEYLNKLKKWKDDSIIKVITGIRRCGKSTLLLQFQNYLLENDVEKEQIITINFEDLQYEELLDYKVLYKYINDRLQSNKMNYIFLDEIQKVESFEKVVDSLYIKDNVDIYITGSNSYMLSGDLATLLTGRYVEISLLPFSFKEFLEVNKMDKEDGFAQYLKIGGMPYVAQMNQDYEKIDMYLEGIYNTVIVKDIEDRQRRKEKNPNKRKVTDINLLKAIAKYLSSTIGSMISVKNVTNYLISSGTKVSPNTVSDYMEALSESFIFYPVERFDIIGKQVLKTNNKWYLVDLGIRSYILPRKEYDLGFSLENIIYFELLRRGYKVNVGKFGVNEVDFVAQKQGSITYFQVTASMIAEETFNREMKPLKNIKDNYQKVILTLDNLTVGNYEGIEVINAIDWLLDY